MPSYLSLFPLSFSIFFQFTLFSSLMFDASFKRIVQHFGKYAKIHITLDAYLTHRLNAQILYIIPPPHTASKALYMFMILYMFMSMFMCIHR